MDSRGGRNTDSLLLNDLKTKYFQNDIYVSIFIIHIKLKTNELSTKFSKFFKSYISEVLVAINPNKANDSLYSFEMIKKYQNVSLGVLPPHLFSVGK